MPFISNNIIKTVAPPLVQVPITPVVAKTYEGEWVNWSIGADVKREFISNKLNFYKENGSAIVFGNGISRTANLIERIKHTNSKKIINYYNILYVCNMGYVDIDPDFLVVTNKLLAAKIPKELHSRVYTRPEIMRINPDMNLIPMHYNLDAGTTAAMLACFHGAKKVFLFGFDGAPDGKSNNIYTGQQFYPQNSEDVDDIKWQEDLGRVISAYPDTTFYRVNTNPPNARQLLKLTNYQIIDNKMFVSLADL